MIRFEEITNKNIWKVCALELYGFVENGDMCGNEIVAVYEL